MLLCQHKFCVDNNVSKTKRDMNMEKPYVLTNGKKNQVCIAYLIFKKKKWINLYTHAHHYHNQLNFFLFTVFLVHEGSLKNMSFKISIHIQTIKHNGVSPFKMRLINEWNFVNNIQCERRACMVGLYFGTALPKNKQNLYVNTNVIPSAISWIFNANLRLKCLK